MPCGCTDTRVAPLNHVNLPESLPFSSMMVWQILTFSSCRITAWTSL